MRWVQLEKSKTKESEFFDIQYENLPYFCFSCGLLGHAELMCPTPAGRDEYGRPPYREALRHSLNKNRGWGGAPSYKQEGTGNGGRQRESDATEEEVEPGVEVNSPQKQTEGKVKQTVYQFNARGRGSNGRGNRGGSGILPQLSCTCLPC